MPKRKTGVFVLFVSNRNPLRLFLTSQPMPQPQNQNLLPLIQVCLVLQLLKKPSQSVKELAENIDFCQTTVRKYLAKLEECKVVKTESWQPTRYFIAEDAP